MGFRLLHYSDTLKFFPIKGKKTQNPFIRWEYFNPSSKLQQFSGRQLQDVTVVHTRNDTAKKACQAEAKPSLLLPLRWRHSSRLWPLVLMADSPSYWLLMEHGSEPYCLLLDLKVEMKLINMEEEAIKSQWHENYRKKKINVLTLLH